MTTLISHSHISKSHSTSHLNRFTGCGIHNQLNAAKSTQHGLNDVYSTWMVDLVILALNEERNLLHLLQKNVWINIFTTIINDEDKPHPRYGYGLQKFYI